MPKNIASKSQLHMEKNTPKNKTQGVGTFETEALNASLNKSNLEIKGGGGSQWFFLSSKLRKATP